MHIVLLTILWLAGIWVADSTNLTIDWWLVPGLCFFAAAIPPLFRPELRRYSLYLFCGASFLFGGARFVWSQPDLGANHISQFVGEEVEVSGTISEEPEVRDRTIHLVLEIESVIHNGVERDGHGQILLRTPRYPIIPYGSRLTVSGELEEPFVSAEFDYKQFLERKAIYGVMSFPRVTEQEAAEGRWLTSRLLWIKHEAQAAIVRLIPAPESGLLSGILLGIDHTMPESIDEAFRTVGITHIVVISGFNITVISSIFLALFSPVFGRNGSVIATLIGITLFTLLVGADPSVVRAAIMGGIYVVTQKLLGRRNAQIPILLLAAWLMTLVNPQALFDIGFQLSFTATLSLILYAQPFTERVHEWLKNRYSQESARLILQVISESVLVTLAAQVLTLPLIVYYFGQLSIISVLANALVLPVQPIIMGLGGLFVLAATGLPLVAQMLGWAVWVFLRYTIWVAELLARVPYATVDLQLGAIGLLAIFGLIAGLTWLSQQEVEKRQKWLGWLRHNLGRRVAVGGSLVCLTLGWQMALHRPDGHLHVIFFDVGQGDATWIQTPSGRQILVDGGYYPVRMQQHLGQSLPFWDREIDFLIATHPDADHVTGLPDLFNRYRFGQLLVVYPEVSDGDEGAYAQLLARAADQGSEIVRPTAGDVLAFEDGVRIEIIHPGPELIEEGRNDNSLSFRLVYGETTVLLTGDAEEAGEQEMLATGLPLAANVYKAGHHGAKNASSKRFLDAVAPQLVIVSAGADNRFGHPHPETLTRVQSHGATVLRTDEVGSIELISDGRQLWIEHD